MSGLYFMEEETEGQRGSEAVPWRVRPADRSRAGF